MFYVVANYSGQRELAVKCRTASEASRWIARVREDWQDAPAFTVESEAPPTDPLWFNSQD